VPAAPYEQAGKVITLGTSLHVSGNVVAFNGPVATAQVQAVVSSPSVTYNAFQDMLDSTINSTASPAASSLRAAFIPRASAGEVNSHGDFDLWTDPGVFDLSVRPNLDTGFPWLVVPNYTITSASAGLGNLVMPLPVSYRGTVTVPGAEEDTPVSSALIRAYIYLKGNQYTAGPDDAVSLLQIAETRAGVNGVFNLLIPAELNDLAPVP
jgi:hypothetical protein